MVCLSLSMMDCCTCKKIFGSGLARALASFHGMISTRTSANGSQNVVTCPQVFVKAMGLSAHPPMMSFELALIALMSLGKESCSVSKSHPTNSISVPSSIMMCFFPFTSFLSCSKKPDPLLFHEKSRDRMIQFLMSFCHKTEERIVQTMCSSFRC